MDGHGQWLGENFSLSTWNKKPTADGRNPAPPVKNSVNHANLNWWVYQISDPSVGLPNHPGYPLVHQATMGAMCKLGLIDINEARGKCCLVSFGAGISLLKDPKGTLAGGFTYFFYFHPYLGTWANLTSIFQMGWNHQLEQILHTTKGIHSPKLTTGTWNRLQKEKEKHRPKPPIFVFHVSLKGVYTPGN